MFRERRADVTIVVRCQFGRRSDPGKSDELKSRLLLLPHKAALFEFVNRLAHRGVYT